MTHDTTQICAFCGAEIPASWGPLAQTHCRDRCDLITILEKNP